MPGILALAPLSLSPAQASLPAVGRGFLFKPPTGSISIRAGYAVPSAKSEIFSFSTTQLTLDRGDFSSPAVAADLAFRVLDRVDLVLGTAYSVSMKKSEFRDWVDEGPTSSNDDDEPIEQTTSFERAPFTISARYYLMNRGRQVGSFAWIPRKYTPYVGAGAGLYWHRFRQKGDFVDFQSLNVFPHTFESSGVTPTTHVFAGMDYSISSRMALTTEARYASGRGQMSMDFTHFDRIDLSGMSVTAGVNFRF